MFVEIKSFQIIHSQKITGMSRQVQIKSIVLEEHTDTLSVVNTANSL